MQTVLRLLRSESGASAAEYALLLAIVGSAIAVSAMLLGGRIADSMNTTSARLTDCTDGGC